MSGDFSFLKGNIYTIILCSLYGTDGKSGDKYGYEIAKEIKERTDNKYEIKQPTLYSYLKKLEQQEQIESYWGTESNGGRRRYYKLTPKGRHDCEQFIAEWEYHKSVLSNLVDAPAVPIEVTQEDVTPLFGEKHKRVKPSAEHIREMNEQDELSRRLDALIGATDIAPEEEPPVVQKPSKPSQMSLFEAIDENTVVDFDKIYQTDEDDEEDDYNEVAATTASDEYEEDEEYIVEADEEDQHSDEFVEEDVNVKEPVDSEDIRSKFEVKQDNAEDFMQKFEERARAISDVQENQGESNENYQHVLMKMIGDQLDDMRDYDSEQQDGAQKYYTDHPVALEDVADELAQQGIRMRLYSHTFSNFKSKTLMPLSSVLCKTSWITFAVAAVFFGILLFVSIAQNNWQPFLITLAVVALVPIAFTAFALYDPSRKDKPRFMFGRFLIATCSLAAIIILFALGISIITNIELSNFAEVSTKILIPTGIAILLPVFVVTFNYFYKKY